MTLRDLNTALGVVATTYNESAAALLPLARSAINEPALDLSRLLLGTIALGSDPSGGWSNSKNTAQISACRALEFLDQALTLGTSVASDHGYDEDKLLVTDYLYGQAIDQVIEADEPAVIGVLAAAIAGAAEDKLEQAGRDYRIRLRAAALDIALILGDFDTQTLASITDIRRLAAAGDDNWRAALPAGDIATDFIQTSRAAVNSD